MKFHKNKRVALGWMCVMLKIILNICISVIQEYFIKRLNLHILNLLPVIIWIKHLIRADTYFQNVSAWKSKMKSYVTKLLIQRFLRNVDRYVFTRCSKVHTSKVKCRSE